MSVILALLDDNFNSNAWKMVGSNANSDPTPQAMYRSILVEKHLKQNL